MTRFNHIYAFRKWLDRRMIAGEITTEEQVAAVLRKEVAAESIMQWVAKHEFHRARHKQERC